MDSLFVGIEVQSVSRLPIRVLIFENIPSSRVCLAMNSWCKGAKHVVQHQANLSPPASGQSGFELGRYGKAAVGIGSSVKCRSKRVPSMELDVFSSLGHDLE